MNKALVLSALLLLAFCTGSTSSAVSRLDEIEIVSSFGPLGMWQSSDWVGADTFLSPLDAGSSGLDEFEIANGLLEFIDYQLMPPQSFLEWDHDRYMVRVHPEEDVVFSVIYFDPYGNPPSAGYPKVAYRKEGEPPALSLPLSLAETQGGRMKYSGSLSVPPGTYLYQYLAKNDNTGEFSLETSTFVTTERPAACVNSGITDASVVSNARVLLRWSSDDGGSDGISYRLFLGETPGDLRLAYEGGDPQAEISSLRYGRQYYWQVEIVNKYGAASLSPLYLFSTITPPEKAYNYPNPFNPASGQGTNILFDMPARGSAELRVYSEQGDLCWQRSYEDLPPGANEVLYDGKDDHGNLLYNGTYVCLIRKKYSGEESRDRCRILIIK